MKKGKGKVFLSSSQEPGCKHLADYKWNCIGETSFRGMEFHLKHNKLVNIYILYEIGVQFQNKIIFCWCLHYYVDLKKLRHKNIGLANFEFQFSIRDVLIFLNWWLYTFLYKIIVFKLWGSRNRFRFVVGLECFIKKPLQT